MDLNLFNFFGIDFTWTFFVQLLILITLFLIYMAVLEIKDHTRDMFDRENNTTDKNKYKK
jgi:cell division protein FtsL